MFTILPREDPELIASYKPATDTAALLVYENEGENMGHIAIEQRGDRLFIIGFEIKGFDPANAPTPTEYTDADGLIRSAGSYALNRGIYLVCCDREEYFPLLMRFGFEKTEDCLEIDLKELFKPCKHCQ